MIRDRFSVVLQRTVLELQGVPCLPLEDVSPDRKSVMASRSFGGAVTSLAELRQAVASHTARAAEKMRRQGLATTGVVVFMHTNRFRPDLPQYAPSRAVRLPVATADTARILAASMNALEAVYKPGFRYAKAGVLFPELVSVDTVQGDLWTQADSPARLRLMSTIDELNRRYGRGTLAFAGASRSAPWHLRRDFSSPHYTTDWKQLLAIRDQAL